MLSDMRVELHCHSVHSDGSEPPEAVAERARLRGVELFCLTDHDNCDGYPATHDACPNVMRGLELSCHEGGRTVHLLLYDATHDDARWQELEDRLVSLRQARQRRLRAIAERLGQLGIHVDIESILAAASTRTVGRPDIAKALVAKGVVPSIDEAFRRYLADGGAANVPLSRLSVEEGLALGRAAGARMSLAHPHTLGDGAAALVSRHRRSGLDGLECFYGNYTSRQRKRWLRLARSQGLVVTGGSDFHGATMPQINEVGVDVPEPHASRLRAWLGV